MSFLWGPTWRETVRLDICKVAMPMTRWWAGKRQAVGSFHELSQSSQKKFNSRKWNNADFRSFGSEKMLWKTSRAFSHDFRKSCLLCMILRMIWRIRIGPALASMFFYPLTSGRFTNTQWRLRLGTLGWLGWVKSVNSFVAKECTIFCFWCQVSCERNPKTSSFQHVLKMFASCLIRLFQVGPSLHGSLAVGTTCCFINHCWIGSSSRWMNRKDTDKWEESNSLTRIVWPMSAMVWPHFILWVCMSSWGNCRLQVAGLRGSLTEKFTQFVRWNFECPTLQSTSLSFRDVVGM